MAPHQCFRMRQRVAGTPRVQRRERADLARLVVVGRLDERLGRELLGAGPLARVHGLHRLRHERWQRHQPIQRKWLQFKRLY